MAKTQAAELIESATYQELRKKTIDRLKEASARVNEIRTSAAPDSELRQKFLQSLEAFNRQRGRDTYFPMILSGLGNGPFVELLDGSVKLDLITGIGINFFGHSHPALMEEMFDALTADPMQGNLQPGVEASTLLSALLARVGPGSRLSRAWFTCSGTMANEIALKIIRQKKNPATRVLAFNDCFAGRSTTMQEITDNPKYREGQPLYGEVDYLPHFDGTKGLEGSIQATVGKMNEILSRYPGKYGALMMEPIQGEGGFTFGPREYYVAVFEAAKKHGLAIWLDEIQTFGRTGELFAYQTLGLQEWVDVVTIAKMFQACAVIYTEEFNPKPGLVAGTFSGSTVALRTARRTLELLDEGKFLGPQGRIAQLSQLFVKRLQMLAAGSCKGKLGEIRAIGGMIAFMPYTGSADDVKSVLMKLFDAGVVAFNCGHGPYLVRMLPPLGAMNESHIQLACDKIEAVLLEMKKG